jgi:hypothetical protein
MEYGNLHIFLLASQHCLVSVFLDLKRDGRGKARLVAGGHRQREGWTLRRRFLLYAPTGLSMLLAVAAHESLELRQFDVCTAFLNGDLEEEV